MEEMQKIVRKLYNCLNCDFKSFYPLYYYVLGISVLNEIDVQKISIAICPICHSSNIKLKEERS